MSQSLLARWKEEDAGGSGVRAAFEASSELDSAKVARSLRLAKSLGMPETVVREQPDWAEQERTARTVEKSPLLAQWAERDAANAALVRDDPDALLDVFEAMQAGRRDDEQWRKDRDALHGVISKTPVGPFEQIPILLREGLDQVGKGLGGFAAGLARTLGNGTFTDSEGNERTYQSDLLNKAADRVENALDAAERALPAPLQAETALGGYLQDVVRQVPQLGAQVLSTAAGGPVTGAAFMGSQIAGSQYYGLTRDGVDSDRAFAAGLADAALQAPLEQLGLGKFMDIFKATGGKAVLKKTLEGAGTEALTEYLQEYPEKGTELWAKLSEDEGAATWFARFVAALPETHREGLYSAAVAAPFGVLGGLGKASYDAARQRRAKAFSEWHIALHDKVEATQAKALAPEKLEDALRAGGLAGAVSLPAAEVLKLYQDGTDILTPMGWKPEDVAEAAAMGQELEAPLSRLHAYLDAGPFNAAAGIMRERPESRSAAEAGDFETRAAGDAARVAALYEDTVAEREAVDAELERIRSELAGAVESVPGLKADAESEGMTPEEAADKYARLLLARAERREARTGVPVAESLRKFNARGLARDERGRLVTPYELAAREEGRAKADAEKPFWDAVWGRLDGQSLKTDHPDAYRELSRLHGPGLFRKGGLPADILADEMERAGVLEQGGGGDALIERLKQGKKPGRLFQGKNPLAERFADMPAVEADSTQWFGEGKEISVPLRPDANSRKTLRDAIKAWAKKRFSKDTAVSNTNTGWKVRVTPKGIEGSLSHGFDDLLARSVPFIPQIIEGGIHLESLRKTPQLISHIFANKIRLDGKDYVVGFVLREDVNGNRFYDHELTEIINPDWLAPGHPSSEGPSGEGSSGHRTNRGDVMNILRDKLGVNDGSGKIFFQPVRQGASETGEMEGLTPGRLFQEERPVVREGITRKADNAVAKVVSLPENAVPEFSGMKDFATWLKDMLADGGNVTIKATGQEARFSSGNLKASVKRSRSKEHRNAYAGLREMVENAEYDRYEAPDERHPDRGRQDVYHSALALGGKLYSVKLKLDVVTEEQKASEHGKGKYAGEDIRYKDHKLTEIEIAPAQDRGFTKIGKAAHGTDAISEVTLGILRGSVKPSGIRGQTLFQSAYHGAPHRFDRFSLDAVGTGETEGLKQGKKPGSLFREENPVVREGITRKADNAVAKVVSIPENAVPEFSGLKDFATWLKDMLAQGGDVEITSTRQVARFTRTNVGASVKRSRSKEHRDAYAALREMVENAEYDHYEGPDDRHPDSGGQDVYYSALKMGDKLYSVKLKLDVISDEQRQRAEGAGEKIEDVRYKDHRLVEIEIAPVLLSGYAQNGDSKQPADAISGITLGILRGAVKPSRIESRALYQPLNEGVDLDAPVKVVEVTPRFAGQNPKILRKRFPEDVRQAVLNEFKAGVVNEDTGKRIGMSANDFKEHLKFSDADTVDGLAQLEAITALPGLMRNAKLVESYEDRKNVRQIKKMHRFQAALRIGDKDYSVKLTVKEFKDGEMALDTDNPIRLYHHRLEKEMPAGNSGQGPVRGVNRPSAGIYEYTLRALLEDVKDSEGQTFFPFGRAPAVVVRGDELGVPEGANIKEYQKAAREVYRGLQKTPAHREDLGEIRFTTAGFGKMLVSGADSRKWKLVPRLKEIIERADYIGRRGLEKERKDEIVAFHWLEADVSLNGESLRVGLQIAEDRHGNKFYNLNQDLEAWREKYEAPDRADIGFGGQELLQDAEASLASKIATPDDGVNLHILEQPGRDNARASIAPVDDGYLIQLYKKADLSSILHEIGHFFLLEMEEDIRNGLADESLRKDYATLRDWLGAAEGQELTREQHELFARGFEAYLREGRAPLKSLESVFARFRKWLTRIYRQARRLNVELTDDVRGVFDRLLATEQEVRTRAEEHALFDLTARELDALGLKGAERVYVSGLMKAARDAAAARLQEARDRKRKTLRQVWAREARETLSHDPVYEARRDMRAQGLDIDAVREEYGEAFAGELMRAVPTGLRKGGADPEIFAAQHGFESAADMLSRVKDAPPLARAVADMVEARQALHDARYDAADYLVETDEAAEQLELVGRYIRKAMARALDTERVAALYEDTVAEQDALERERERVRAEAVAAVESVPGLKAQAESLAGGAEAYVDLLLQLLEAFARRITPVGQSMAETFRRLVVMGLGLMGTVRNDVLDQAGVKEIQKAEVMQTGTVLAAGGEPAPEGGAFYQAGQRAREPETAGRKDDIMPGEGAPPPDRLITLHNVSEDKLLDALRLGALPVPSLGVAKAETPYSHYGEITLIGTRDMVDPGHTPVYSHDRHTAVYVEKAESLAEALENMLDSAKKDGSMGFEGLLAELATRFSSLEEMGEAREKLVSSEIAEEEFSVVADLMDSFTRRAMEHYGKPRTPQDTLWGEAALRALRDASRSGGSEEHLQAAMEAQGFSGMPPDLLALGVKILRLIDTTATDYFEAKPPRAVRLDEFAGAVIPDSADPRIVEALEAAGLEIRRYNGEEQAQRETVRDLSYELERRKGGILFHRKGEPRGAFIPRSEGYLIRLFKNADLSTLLHEIGHVFLEEIDRMAQLGLADPTLLADRAALRRWFAEFDDPARLEQVYYTDFARDPAYGGRAFAELTEEERARLRRAAEHEKFARGFEAYLREGRAPSRALESAFARFKEWLTRIYRQARRLNVELTDDVRDVFDRLLATEQEVRTRAEEHALFNLTAGELDALGLKGAERVSVSGRMKAARNAAAARPQAVADMLEARQALHDGRPDAADYLVETDEAAEQLELGGRYIRKALGKAKEAEPSLEDSEDFGRRAPAVAGREAFQRLAADKMAAMPMRKAVQSGVFRQAMRRALDAERRAIAKGDFAAALEENARARLNLEFARRSLKIRRNVERLQGGITRFTRMHKADPDARFIVADIARRHGLGGKEPRTLFRFGGPVVVSGDELGVPDGAGIKEYITAAKKCHDALKYESEHGKPVCQPQLGRPVRFSGKGFRENARIVANIDKWKLFPKLREIIENSELIESLEPHEKRADGFRYFHRAETNVELDGARRGIGFTLAEDEKGDLFYILNADVEKGRGRNVTRQIKGGSRELFQDGVPSLEKTIGTADDNVNLVIREPEQNVFRPEPHAVSEPVSVRDASTIRNWIAAIEADGYSLFADDTVLCGPEKPWRELTGTQFENLAETVNQIITVERNRRQLLTAQGKADLDAVAEEAAASIRAHVPQRATKTVEDDNTAVTLLERLHVSHLNADTLTRLMDGNRPGPVWRHVIRPINAALGERHRRLKEAKAALRGLFDVYSRKELAAMRGKKVFVPEIGEKLTRENRLMIALNTGNSSNMERLMKGHGWSERQLAAVLNDLTARDWHFVQGVWDYLESFREEAFAMEEKLHGIRPKAVEAIPLTVSTADGETLRLRGGYFPVAYNPAKSAGAPDDTGLTSAKGLMANVPHGYLKERTGNLEVPLKAKLDVIPDHIFKVVHDLAFRPAVLDVAGFLRHKTVQAAIQETAGVTRYRTLWNWLRDVAQEGQGPRGDLDAVLSWTRSSQSLMSMGYKIGTMMQQITGLPVTLDELGPKWTAMGMKAAWSHPEAACKEAAARSSFMANRISSVDREVADYHEKLLRHGRFKWHGAIRDHAFAPMGWVQMMSSDLPAWWGAYEKGMKDFAGDETRAAEYADNMVEITQAGGTLKNPASIRRGSEAHKLLAMYYDFFGALYQIAARRVDALARHRDVPSVMRAANTALLLWFVMPLLSELPAGRAADDGDEDGDPDRLSRMAEITLAHPLRSVIGEREAASGLFGTYGLRLAPGESGYEAVTEAGKAIWKALDEEEPDPGKTADSMAGGAEHPLASPWGAAQVIAAVWNLWDWLDDSDPVFEARDLFFARGKGRK